MKDLGSASPLARHRRRDSGEQRIESLGHRRVRENGIPEERVTQPAKHRRLHHGHDLPALRADHIVKPGIRSVCASTSAFIVSLPGTEVLGTEKKSVDEYSACQSLNERQPPEAVILMSRRRTVVSLNSRDKIPRLVWCPDGSSLPQVTTEFTTFASSRPASVKA